MQKLEMFLVGLRAFAKAVSYTATTVRVDPALIAAFGLPGCAEQSVIAQTLNAATESAHFNSKFTGRCCYGWSCEAGEASDWACCRTG